MKTEPLFTASRDLYQNELGQPVGPTLENWVPCQSPPRTPLMGRFCRLEPMAPEHHARRLFDAFALDTSGKNWTYLFAEPFTDYEAFDRYLVETCCGDDPLFYTVIDQASGLAVGMAALMRIDPRMGVIEVGHIHFSPRMQRTPMSSEAIFLLMSRVFDELGYRRFEWKCDSHNAPSKRAAERFGFSFEGIFRQAVVYKNRSRDTAWFSIIDREWPHVKAMFEGWLAPENFDAQGKQRQPLRHFRADKE